MIRRLLAMPRDAAFLTPSRARAAALIWLFLQILFAGLMASAFHQEAVKDGKPVGTDFMTFWSAARMAVTVSPAAAYDDTAREALQHATSWMGADPSAHYAYWYPPTYLLLTLPLGLLGYLPAMAAFLAASYALVAAAISHIIRPGLARLVLIFSPAMLLNVLIGQNGGFTAACFGGAYIWLDRRPIAAGACLGLLVCKPHLALATPLALAAARRWRAFFACGATAAALCALSYLILGPACWLDFLRHASEARAVLENMTDDWSKIQSVFTAVRLLHGPLPLAYALHIAVALAALAVLLRAASRRPGAGPEVALLVVTSLLCTPYMFDYDLACLLVPMAFIAAAALASTWQPWEKTALLVLYALPLVVRLLATNASLPLVPPALIALLLLTSRRGRAGHSSR
jgi:hypothetical protein